MQKKFYNRDLYIHDLHLELSSKCNAACPMCWRNDHGDKANPELIEEHLDLDVLDNIDVQLQKLTLAGNYGDPLMHPDVIEVVEWFQNKYPDGTINIQTNGGLRNAEWWKLLVKTINNVYRVTVTFGIDGLKDTNHLYRRNVRWDVLMKNAETYISAGGRATWKMLVFKHNQHQIKEAEQLAKDMGFIQFQKIATNRFDYTGKFPVQDKDSNHLYDLEPADSIKEKFVNRNKNRRQTDDPNTAQLFLDKEGKEWQEHKYKINCYAIADTSAYVAADGRTYPCCNTGYHYSNNIWQVQEDHYKINLKENKMSEIISGEFFSMIADRWSSTPLKTCARTCGATRDNLIARVKF